MSFAAGLLISSLEFCVEGAIHSLNHCEHVCRLHKRLHQDVPHKIICANVWGILIEFLVEVRTLAAEPASNHIEEEHVVPSRAHAFIDTFMECNVIHSPIRSVVSSMSISCHVLSYIVKHMITDIWKSETTAFGVYRHTLSYIAILCHVMRCHALQYIARYAHDLYIVLHAMICYAWCAVA